MKKFTKISLIIAGIMVVVGLGFVIAGSVMAGGASAMIDQLRSGDLNFGNWHFDNGVYYKGGVDINVTDIVEETLEILPVGSEHTTNEFSEDITRLEMDTDLANITIKPANVAEITVSLEDGYLAYYDVKVSGNTMDVSYDVGGHTFKQGPKIIVEVPKQMSLEHIYIDTDLGEVKILNLEQPLQGLEINADLGNVIIEECKVNGTCTVTAALGNIEMEDSYFKKIDLGADMGNIEFSGTIEGDITAQADMGNIDVELEGKESDYNIELSTDMGEVTYKGQKQGGMGGTITYYQENAIGDINLNCDMGDVELSFE